MIANVAREKLRPIIEQQAITFAVTHLEPLEIDINILNASIKAMQECVLKNPNQYIIVDGNSPLEKGIKNSGRVFHSETF
jgi:ribonuclease HII